MDWLRRLDWERHLRLVEGIGAGLGLLLVVLTLTPAAVNALGPWIWLALTVGLVLLVVNAIALLARPVRALFAWAGKRSPLEIHVTRKPRAPQRLDQTELGFLDYEKDFMGGLVASAKVLGRISLETTRQTARIVASTGQLTAAKGAPIDRRLRVTRHFANQTDGYARRLERLEAAYRRASQRMTTGGRGAFRTNPANNDLSPLSTSSAALRESTTGYRNAIRQNKTTTQEARDMNVSQDVNRAYERVIGALDKLIEDADGIIQFCNDAEKILEARKPRPAPSVRSTPSKRDSRR